MSCSGTNGGAGSGGGAKIADGCLCGAVRYEVSGPFLRAGHWPDGPEVSIRLGTVDGDPGIRPQSHTFVSSRAVWDRIADDLPQFEAGLRFRGSLGTVVEGHDGFRTYMDAVRAAFPDFHNHVDEITRVGDRVVARLTWIGTQRGPVLGLPASGRAVRYQGIA